MAITARLLARATIIGGALMSATLLPAVSVAAFNPDAGADAPVVNALPDPKIIYRPPSVSRSATGTYVAPLAPAPVAPAPLYPERSAAPPMETAVAEAADVAPVSDPLAAPFIPPAPLAAVPIPMPTPPVSAIPAPSVNVGGTPSSVVVAEPVNAPPSYKPSELSDETRRILSHVTGNLDSAPPQKTSKISVNRASPDVAGTLGGKVDAYESVGISIKVRRSGLDADHELNRAYTSLMGGDTEAAIETYKNILSVEPKNQEALFGLAATYHRLGNIDKARPLYGMLLQVNPGHREGLNNFLVLVSDESPQDALPELERLEARNPSFSPIPAQIAAVLDKLGYKEEARNKMIKAIDLAPNNLTYKYNLAVMLDKHGHGGDAAALYRMLIEASLRGEKVPSTTDAMQRRVNYLSAALNSPTVAAVQAIPPIN